MSFTWVLLFLFMLVGLPQSLAQRQRRPPNKEIYCLSEVNKALKEINNQITVLKTPETCNCPIRDADLSHLTLQSPKEKILAYMKKISGQYTISGQRNYFHYHDRDQALDEIKRITGEYPGISSSWLWTNGHNMWKYTDTLISEWRNGSFIILTIRQCSPLQPKCHTFGQLSQIQWKRLLTDGSKINKKWKAGLDSVVPYMKKLEAAGVSSIVNMLGEINDDRQWWGGVKTKNKGSIQLYKMTHDYLTNHHGLKSLIWMWTVLDKWNSVASLRQYWPGNDYVDIAALYLESKEEPTDFEYQSMLQIAGDKPIIIGHMLVPPNPALFIRQPKWVAFIRRHETMSKAFHKNVNETYHHPRILNQNEITAIHGL